MALFSKLRFPVSSVKLLIRVIKPILTLIHVIFSFVFVYSLLTVFLIPLLLLLCYRSILSLVFHLCYKNKYKLFESPNGIHAPDFYASVYTIYAFIYVDGPSDIGFLRNKIHTIFTTHVVATDGSHPYELMLCKVIKKFGFYCWENVRENFDISHHIRYFPGCSNPSTIYAESDVFEAAAKLADKPWGNERPRWEFLLVPQMRVNDPSGKIVSVIHLRLQHSYGDGVSLAQLLRCCVGDAPPPQFVYDPVNLPGPLPPFYHKLLAYLQVFFLGPWVGLRFALHKERHIFYEGPLKGGKLMGRDSLNLTVADVRLLRKHYNCTTTAIQHYAMTGAMQQIALRRKLPLPKEILGSIVTVLLPYPNIYPQNRIMMFLEKFPIGIKNPFKRLSIINRICKTTSTPASYYIPLTSRVLNRVIGILPSYLIDKLVVLIQLSYCVSNVPGVTQSGYINGCPIYKIVATGPLLNGFRFVVGIGCFEHKFTFGFQSEKSKLIRNRDDLQEFIEEFENQIKYLLENINV